MPGLFETIRIRQGAAPFLGQHVARLMASCQVTGRQPPAPGIESRVLAHLPAADIIVRVTMDDRGERVETRAVPPAGPMRIVFSGTRHEVYVHKSTLREVFDRARSRVVPFRADEAILLTGEGFLAEGCVTSVFFWQGSTLCTPTLELGILPGIGRARVIELARERKVTVEEGKYTRSVVEGLPLFLVNSVRGVLETAVHGDWRRPRDDRTRALADRFWG
jgi:branched-subunit amino acid aminotransferase/4-amino-4-deoxychorismate lyase